MDNPRRQSLPEAMLAAHHHLLPPAPTPKPSVEVRHSDETRFSRTSKRKSQSLYEAHSVLSHAHGNIRDFEGEPHVLARVQSSPNLVQTEPIKHEGEEQEQEEELDFLLGFSRHSNNLNSEEKHVNGDAEEQQQSLFFEHRPKRRSVHEPLVSGFEGFHAQGGHFDDFTPMQQASSLPTFQHQHPYDNLGFNPLNNLQPLGVNMNMNMNAFQLNPLGNLQQLSMYEQIPFSHGHNLFHQAPSDELDASPKGEKKRRSRVPSSVYRGVSRCGKDNKFQARIRVHGKVKYLGRFKSEVEAAKCYDKHAVEYLGVNAQTNFPFMATSQPSN